jgi:hypothetical protein
MAVGEAFQNPEMVAGNPGEIRPSFFQPSTGTRGESPLGMSAAVCAHCLGRHDRTFAKCEAQSCEITRLAEWPEQNERGKLVGVDAMPVCYDDQVEGANTAKWVTGSRQHGWLQRFG